MAISSFLRLAEETLSWTDQCSRGTDSTLHAKFRDSYVFSYLLAEGMYFKREQNVMCFYCFLMGAC